MFRVVTEIVGAPGGPYWSTQHFGEASVAQNCVNAVRDFWNDIAAYLYNPMTLTVSNEVAVIDVATGEQTGLEVVTAPALVDAAGSGDPLPWSTQGLLRFRTGVYISGKELRGRLFVPGMAESASDSGAPSSTVISAIGSAWSLSMAVTDVDPVVYSPTHHQNANIISASFWNKWAYLGSRRD